MRDNYGLRTCLVIYLCRTQALGPRFAHAVDRTSVIDSVWVEDGQKSCLHDACDSEYCISGYLNHAGGRLSDTGASDDALTKWPRFGIELVTFVAHSTQPLL